MRFHARIRILRRAPMSSPEPALARTWRVVVVSLVTQILETAALAAAAVTTGSPALVAQTFAAGSDIAVQVFLVLGVRLSARAADATHPVGYGRERYFWSLFGALAVFVSGFAVAIEEALRGALHPAEVSNFAVGYVVLGVSLVLESIAFVYSLREVQLRARALHASLALYLRSTTEPATTTEFLGNTIGLAGGILATLALALTQATGSRWPDVIASGLIGIALMTAAVVLTQQNRSLLTGRGVSPRLLEDMRTALAAQPGVVEIPSLLAVVVGPAALVVDGDVTFEDALTVPEVEAALAGMARGLKARWPEVRYVYLTPVGEATEAAVEITGQGDP
jgi:cation diffusion facilitator family transporter